MRPLVLPGRRRLLAPAVVVLSTAATVLWSGSRLVGLGRRVLTLLSGGLVVGWGGGLYPLVPGDTAAYIPGTRLPRIPEPRGLTTSQQSALARQALACRQAARSPQGRRADLANGAPTDLLALTGPALMSGPMIPAGPADPSAEPSAGSTPPPTPTSAGGTGREGRGSRDSLPSGVEIFPPGAVVVAPMGIWCYVWPRDAAFVAAALSAVNLADEALGILGNLASWQRADGGLEVRYTSSGRVSDDRPAQANGVGWLLWAAGRFLVNGVSAADPCDRLGVPLVRTASRFPGITDTPSYPPTTSPDYWEVAETAFTLGTAAPVFLGLEAAAALARVGIDLGGPTQALAERVTAVRSAIGRNFAPAWDRHLQRDDVDAAIALVPPPFTRPPAGA